MIGWLRERRADEALLAAGWAGAMSLPRTVTMLNDGSLAFAPVEEVALLRGRHIERPLRPGVIDLDGIPGDACEITCARTSAPTGPIALEVRRSPDGAERTLIRLDPAGGTLLVDRRTPARMRWRSVRWCVQLCQMRINARSRCASSLTGRSSRSMRTISSRCRPGHIPRSKARAGSRWPKRTPDRRHRHLGDGLTTSCARCRAPNAPPTSRGR